VITTISCTLSTSKSPPDPAVAYMKNWVASVVKKQVDGLLKIRNGDAAAALTNADAKLC
jgi:hypothetical protein